MIPVALPSSEVAKRYCKVPRPANSRPLEGPAIHKYTVLTTSVNPTFPHQFYGPKPSDYYSTRRTRCGACAKIWMVQLPHEDAAVALWSLFACRKPRRALGGLRRLYFRFCVALQCRAGERAPHIVDLAERSFGGDGQPVAHPTPRQRVGDHRSQQTPYRQYVVDRALNLLSPRCLRPPAYSRPISGARVDCIRRPGGRDRRQQRLFRNRTGCHDYRGADLRTFVEFKIGRIRQLPYVLVDQPTRDGGRYHRRGCSGSYRARRVPTRAYLAVRAAPAAVR